MESLGQLRENVKGWLGLKNIMNLECAAYKADFLCDDPMVAEQIIKKLEGPLGQALKKGDYTLSESSGSEPGD